MVQEHSKVAYQVMWNRLISVVEEQAQALVTCLPASTTLTVICWPKRSRARRAT